MFHGVNTVAQPEPSSRRRPGTSLLLLDPGLRRGDGGQGRPPHVEECDARKSSVARASVPGNLPFHVAAGVTSGSW